MKRVTFTSLVLLVAACTTRPNPNRCCTDAADCDAAGLPLGSDCNEGLVCRGNQCISQPCASSAECDGAAPYCIEERCAEACTDDLQCPGFGQTADLRFCEAGSCVQCRATADCSASAPVCDGGSCRVCREHSECALGVCAEDGTCAAPSEIAFVSTTGSSGSECMQLSPCTLVRGLSVTPQRRYVVIETGTYSHAQPLVVGGGPRSLIGHGTAPPRITRTGNGPIFTIDTGTDATFERLEIANAAGTSEPFGNGIECPADPPASRTVRIRDVLLANNARNGLESHACAVIAERSRFVSNGMAGMYVQDGNADIDACAITGSQTTALMLDGGLYTLTNSFIYRNAGGIDFYSTISGNRFEFNTIVDNGANTPGVACNVSNTPSSHPNNVIARNQLNTFGNSCTFPSSIIVDMVTDLKFKSPDATPYDYHLQAGSLAIDAATISPVDHDFDGDARPNGAVRDVGADEYVP